MCVPPKVPVLLLYAVSVSTLLLFGWVVGSQKKGIYKLQIFVYCLWPLPYILLVCATLVCVCTPKDPCSITIGCISVYTIVIWLGCWVAEKGHIQITKRRPKICNLYMTFFCDPTTQPNNNSVDTNTAYSNRTGTFGGTHTY